MEDKKRLYLTICVCTLAVCATLSIIFRYEKISGTNYTMILNKWTGEKELITANGDLIQVNASGSFSGPELKSMDIEENKLTLTLSIKWRDGKIYYKTSVNMPKSTYDKSKENINSRITLVLQDANGYPVKELPIGLNSFVTSIGSTDPVDLSFDSSQPMRLSDFKAIADWNISWNLSD